MRKSGKLHDAISTLYGRFGTDVDTKVNADRDSVQITMVMRCHVAVRRVEAKDAGDTIATCIHPRPHKVSGSMRRTCRDKGDGSVWHHNVQDMLEGSLFALASADVADVQTR